MPHSHILLILDWGGSKPVEIGHYDQLVCAEHPDKILFLELYEIIGQCNVHGPCADFNPSTTCMINGKCSRCYPCAFSQSIVVGDDGYPMYMQREGGRIIQVKGVMVDNRWIVPFNPFLSMKYKAHINVEVCSIITTVKYLYKYVYKGHDK